jgi:hypothetical protein
MNISAEGKVSKSTSEPLDVLAARRVKLFSANQKRMGHAIFEILTHDNHLLSRSAGYGRS